VQQQARELLAPVYGWFTEGFDTRDLKEAKALLDGSAAWTTSANGTTPTSRDVRYRSAVDAQGDVPL